MPTDVIACANPDCNESFVPNSWNQRYHNGLCKRVVENTKRRRADEVSPPSLVPDVDIDTFTQVEYLRRENRRLTNLVAKHKSNSMELVHAVYNAAHAALSTLDVKPVKPPKRVTGKGDEEVANPFLSDFQLGKVTPTYNSDVCVERVNIFADKVLRLTDIQRADHPVRRAHVYALGDLVEGEDIFPGQAFEIDSSLYRQVVQGVELVTDYLRRMLSHFETVHFVGVIGNHGKLSSKRAGDYNPETNMDRLLYKFVSMLFADEPRITFDIPEGRGEGHFYAVDYIGDYGTLLMHGDQLSTPTSSHAYYKKVLGWKDTGIPERFDDVCIGHWHQNTKLTLGTTVLRIAGTPESDNQYAKERLGVMGRPSQHMQFVHPRRGPTAEYDVYLD